MPHLRLLFVSLLLLLVGPLPSGGAPTYEMVAEFERPPSGPSGKLVYVPATGLYYGTTQAGGAFDLGTVYSLTPAGGRTTLVSFSGTTGATKGEAPTSGVILAADGSLYGTTTKGGASDCGTMFRVTTGGSFTTLVQFTGTDTGAARGATPNGLLQTLNLLGTIETFYCTTQGGGANGDGTMFTATVILQSLSLTPSTVFDFNGANGDGPVGALVTDGTSFYGVTERGGASDFGAVFKITPPFLLGNYTGTVLTSFKNTGTQRPGAYPEAGLLLHPNGFLYGTTSAGGVSDGGTIFKIATNATQSTGFTTLTQFTDLNGAEPSAELVLGDDNDTLYGTTLGGGPDTGNGTIFTISSAGGLVTLHNFSGDDGDGPTGPMLKLANGDFVGTTNGGGPGGYGTFFQQSNPTFGNTFQTLTTFTNTTGWRPAGTPAFDTSSNTIYQPMALGGTLGNGTLLKVVGSTPTVLTNFTDDLGEEPNGGLGLVGGILYSAAKSGGSRSAGTIYQYVPGGTTSLVATMTNATGNQPEGPLVQGPDGSLYGVAREGGAFQNGAIIKIDSAGVRSTVLSFTGVSGAAPGTWPHAPLAVGADGNLYGATERGGSADAGEVFKITLAGAFTQLKAFSLTGPASPLAGLTAGGAGVFYGTTAAGGAANVGTIFKITDTGTYTTLAEFTGATGTLRGAFPVGGLLYAFDGALYGVTAESGPNDEGTIFRLKADNTAETLFDFTNMTGAVLGGAPRGGLAFGNDGYLYGATEEGGPRGGGVIYRIKGLGPMTVTDPITYNGLVATANGRAQTGGDPSTVVRFEIDLLPNLLGLTLSVPANVTVANGIATFSMPVPTGLLGQLVYVRAYASNAFGVAEGVIRNTTALLPLQAWKTQYFGNPNTPDLDDTDHDGALNLTEYAAVKDPTVPNANALPAPIIKVYAEGPRLALFLTRDPSRNDVTIDVQAAPSPTGPWTSVATSANGAPFSGAGYVGGDGNTSGIKTVEIRDVPPAGATSRFMRVVASH